MLNSRFLWKLEFILFDNFIREVFALQTNGLSQFSHNCFKTVSKSSQFVFIHFLGILNISKIERCFFGKNAKSIILPVQIFVRGQMFFGEKTISLSFFCFFCTLGKRLWHFGRKRLGNLLQFALCVSRKSFWKKIFLEKNCLQLFVWL